MVLKRNLDRKRECKCVTFCVCSFLEKKNGFRKINCEKINFENFNKNFKKLIFQGCWSCHCYGKLISKEMGESVIYATLHILKAYELCFSMTDNLPIDRKDSIPIKRKKILVQNFMTFFLGLHIEMISFYVQLNHNFRCILYII